MVLTEYGHIVTPVDTCKMALDNGFRTPNNGTAWGFFAWAAKKYGLEFRQTDDFNNFISALRSGALVICSMGKRPGAKRGFFTSSGHYILAWGIDSKGIYANDSISKSRTNIPVSPDIWRYECEQYFILKKKGRFSMSLEQAVKFLTGKAFEDGSLWLKNAKADAALANILISFAEGWSSMKNTQYFKDLLENIQKNLKGNYLIAANNILNKIFEGKQIKQLLNIDKEIDDEIGEYKQIFKEILNIIMNYSNEAEEKVFLLSYH
jgi:hypothetical protein